VLELRVANHGNVTETLPRTRVTLVRPRTMHRLATLFAARRDVRPHTQGILELRVRPRLWGSVRALVVIPAVPGRRVIRRMYAIRL
jgi:hypothetical protein